MRDFVFLSYSSEDIKGNPTLVSMLNQLLKEFERYSIKYHNYREDYFPLEEVSTYLSQSKVVIIFINKDLSEGVSGEVTQVNNNKEMLKVLCISGSFEEKFNGNAGAYTGINTLRTKTSICKTLTEQNQIVEYVNEILLMILKSFNLLSSELPYFSSYEKDIIQLYKQKYLNQLTLEGKKHFAEGIPQEWPDILMNSNYLNGLVPNPINGTNQRDIKKNRVNSGALAEFYPTECKKDETMFCISRSNFTFPEAGLREKIRNIFDNKSGLDSRKKIGIVVSGGIAPGINAVIHAIVQRHWKYYAEFHNSIYARGEHNQFQTFFTSVMGFKNGFTGLYSWIRRDQNPNGGNKWIDMDANSDYEYLFDTTTNQKMDFLIGHNNLKSRVTSKYIDEPGSILPTSRATEFIDRINNANYVKEVISGLVKDNIRVLYIIGGEGSMRFAHQLAIYAQRIDADVSIVGIPKTMDNDILWVWKPFGFESAVIKASEFINQLSWEIMSNPKLAIVQLFGSFSGFVTSHAVLGCRAQNCDLVLIPELTFKIRNICELIKNKLQTHRQSLVVLSECAFPSDLDDYLKELTDNNIGNPLSIEEIAKLRDANKIFQQDGNKSLRNRYGPTKDYDEWSSPLFKLIIYILERDSVNPLRQQGFSIGKTITNRPQHLVRSIPPSPIDIIHAERLGFLAVDSAMAGCTDFMISQWLTEYCLVPLSLVTMGSKQIPITGTFWKSVIAKTGQTERLN